MSIAEPSFQLEVASLQAFLDRYLDAHPRARLDYIHGDDVLEQLTAEPDSIGFLLPTMDKRDLFKDDRYRRSYAAQDVLAGRGRGEAVLLGVSAAGAVSVAASMRPQF